MTKTELLATARIFLDDYTAPYLWSDAELETYIQDAESEAAERAGLLPIEGDSYCTIPVIASTSSYSVDPLVYAINKAWLSGDNTPLTRTSREQKELLDYVWESETGTPTEYIFEGGKIRLYPTPTANTTLYLTGYRYPVTPMGTSPEIGAEHHRRMLDWVYRLAFLKRDKATYEPKLAMDYDGLFTRSFGPKIDFAALGRMRKETATIMRDAGGY